MKTTAWKSAVPIFGAALMLTGHAERAFTQTGTWKPDKAVEIVVNTAPASGPDKTARLMQKIFQESRSVEMPVTVANKPGGERHLEARWNNASSCP